MQINSYRNSKLLLLALLFLFSKSFTYAQCAMCRASLESSHQTQQAEAINNGIVYLMVIPYILVGLIGIYIYNLYKTKKTNKKNINLS